jgi:hypothetical protein
MPPQASDTEGRLKKWAGSGSLAAVMILWGFHLGFPLQLLQHVRATLFGHVVPVYYFFVVLPLVGAAALLLAFKRSWTRWELLWWALPLICLPGILASGDRLWSGRQWLSWVVRNVIPGGILLGAGRVKARSMLVYAIYPIIIAASLLGLWEIYDDGRINLWDNSLLQVHLEVAQADDNPFYRPQAAAYQLPLSNRPGGTQGNRLAYASTLVGFLPLGLWLLKYKKKARPLLLAAVGALSSVLILSQVRSVWLAALMSLAAMGMLGLWRDRRDAVKCTVWAACCLAFFLAWPRTHHMLWSRLNSFHLEDASIRARLRVLQTALVLRDHGLFGVGYGQFPTACRQYAPQGQIWEATPDNQYLRWAIENGVASLLLLVTFLVGFVRAGWKRIELIADARQADLYKCLLAGWLSVAVTFFFFDGFYWGACGMTFWCLLGLFGTCLRPETEWLVL